MIIEREIHFFSNCNNSNNANNKTDVTTNENGNDKGSNNNINEDKPISLSRSFLLSFHEECFKILWADLLGPNKVNVLSTF